MKLILSVLCLSALEIASLNTAFAIEGGNKETLVKYASTLKSVLFLDFIQKATPEQVAKHESGDEWSCTGTLISKNIILTARHCVNEIHNAALSLNVQKAKDGSVPKDTVFKVNNQKVKIVDVLMADKEYEGLLKNKQLTDIALILFKSENCAASVLKDLPTIAFVKPNNGHQYTNDILMSGYGISGFSKEDSGVLRAGTGKIANQSDLAEYDKKVKNSLAKGDGIFAIAEREDYLKMKAPQGVVFDLGVFLSKAKPKVTTDNTALTLSGDSGGAAIGFDEAGNATVLGVTSHVMPAINYQSYKVSLRASDVKILDETYTEDDIAAAKDTAHFIGDLLLKGSEKQELLRMADVQAVNPFTNEVISMVAPVTVQPFQLSLTSKRTSVSEYASLTAPKNSRFLQKSLAALEEEKAADASICQ